MDLQTVSPHYPELYDKPHNLDYGKFILTKCTTSFLKGSCESGHHYAKALVCGREWCEDCGQSMSAIHKRRIARWWGKAIQFEKMGYLVVTVPAELRNNFKEKKILSEFRTYCKRKLQRMGYKRGLIRYHWAGDCTKCKGKGCNDCSNTGADKQFKPHLNILIDEGYLSKQDFENKFVTLRNDVERWFKNKFNTGKTLKGNLFYSYATSEAHKIHKLKYITRSTMRFYNTEVCEIIKGFRTTSVWGKWQKNDVKRVSELVSLENSQCPCCGNGIKWRKEFINRRTFYFLNPQHISAGYYLVDTS